LLRAPKRVFGEEKPDWVGHMIPFLRVITGRHFNHPFQWITPQSTSIPIYIFHSLITLFVDNTSTFFSATWSQQFSCPKTVEHTWHPRLNTNNSNKEIHSLNCLLPSVIITTCNPDLSMCLPNILRFMAGFREIPPDTPAFGQVPKPCDATL
jgi:hypothetical protein